MSNTFQTWRQYSRLPIFCRVNISFERRNAKIMSGIYIHIIYNISRRWLNLIKLFGISTLGEERYITTIYFEKKKNSCMWQFIDGHQAISNKSSLYFFWEKAERNWKLSNTFSSIIYRVLRRAKNTSEFDSWSSWSSWELFNPLKDRWYHFKLQD